METPFVQDLNYLRLNDLIQTNAKPVVRIVFDEYFLSHQHGQLSKILCQYMKDLEAMKLHWIITPPQWRCLFPFVGMCILYFVMIYIYIKYKVYVYEAKKTGIKVRFTQPFHSYGTNTHTFYTLRPCINIVFILQNNRITPSTFIF